MNKSTFRLRRPLITSNGGSSDVNQAVRKHLELLDQLLGKHIFDQRSVPEEGEHTHPERGDDLNAGKSKVRSAADAEKKPDGDAASADSESKSAEKGRRGDKKGDKTGLHSGADIVEELKKPIYPRKTNGEPDKGLLKSLVSGTDRDYLLNISDAIDRTNELANLKYLYHEHITQNWNTLSREYRAIAQFKNITDYFIAYAYFVKGISEINGLNNFIYMGKFGLNSILSFASVTAARVEMQKRALKLDYNDDDHPLIKMITSGALSISELSFEQDLDKLIDDFINNKDYLKLISEADIGKIPQDYIPLLVQYIKSSPVEITKSNIDYFLPMFINEIRGSRTVEDISLPREAVDSDNDFEVEFFVDEKSIERANASNVKAAAQLYYSMVVGEEMDVFNLMNYFTLNYLINKRIDIKDPRLRQNIQLYVFSNKFIDYKSGRVQDRTRAQERQMFYRQVFDIGRAQVSDAVIMNTEFKELWNAIILESAAYLKYARESQHPDNYVSRQGVMQVVEELQYNLSSNCTGMATVISPLIYSELKFIIDRIFKHPEIISQVVPQDGTWKKVVETLWSEMKSTRINAHFTYMKAMLCQSVIKKVALYNPASFEQDKPFSDFISHITALITTQGKIQKGIKKHAYRNYDPGVLNEVYGYQPGSYDNDEVPDDESLYAGPPQYARANQPAAEVKDEWDY